MQRRPRPHPVAEAHPRLRRLPLVYIDTAFAIRQREPRRLAAHLCEPGEFRRCGAEELDGQALAYAEAAADPSKHELITAVLDLVPVAADRLVQRQRAQP